MVQIETGVGKAPDQRLVVGRDHHRGPKLVQLLEQIEQTHADGVVNIAGRFVGKQQPRPVDHRAGDGDALLLSARQGRRLGVQVLAQSDPVKQFHHMLTDFRLRGAGHA